MPTVAIVGAGLIGRSWAIVFARAGWDVQITDPSAEQLAALPRLIRQGLGELQAHGLVRDAEAAAQRVSPAASIEEAVRGAELVQENGPEVVATKREIFAELDRLAPKDAVLASSTSAIVASQFTGDLAGRERCLVAHPVNPPHLVPLVELCGAPWTTPETIAAARRAYAAVGQVPIVVNREIEGFVLNRLQGALLAEAFRLAGEGIVSPQDLDKTLSDGLGLRWSFMGPFETIDLNAPGGVADYAARYGGTYRTIASGRKPFDWPAATLDKLDAERRAVLPREKIEERSRWRDRRLMALLAHRREVEDGE